MYNPFSCVLAQCLSHILRYLKPYYEDIKHQVPKKMSDFLSNCNSLRNTLIEDDAESFTENEYIKLINEYDSILNEWEKELREDTKNYLF